MNKIEVLDCTLRDGGYINNWDFGINNIKSVVSNLTSSQIDIIECGYLSNKNPYNPEKSIFDSIERIKEVIPEKKHNCKYVCMINFGEYELADIPNYDGSSVDGIRLVFHKGQLEAALEYCRELKLKGYMLFIQPMVTINYSDSELLKIVNIVNEIIPYAFYIVDSFGIMKKNDLMRMYYLIDNNLNQKVRIGYHSHNNLQLAYSNAQALAEVHSNRNRIIDASVFGMGRGAGNLNTELFIQYLNDNFDTNYNVYPLLQIIDETLNKIYATNYWGYSLPHYLSATYNCHPNYASYLSDKNTLSVKGIQDILSKIPPEKKGSFNKIFIEELYIKYQKRNIDDTEAKELLSEIFRNQTIVVIAPGNSIEKNKNDIKKFIKEKNAVCITVNFSSKDFDSQFTFISNTKRYEKIFKDNPKINNKLIITSNVETQSSNHIYVNYEHLVNMNDTVSDNSTLMLLQLLINVGVEKVYIAGFDGYSLDQTKNYAHKELILHTSPKAINELNTGIANVLNKVMEDIKIEFLTPTKYGESIV